MEEESLVEKWEEVLKDFWQPVKSSDCHGRLLFPLVYC